MRASFGGAADLSQQLAIFYNEYQNRLSDLATRAANQAEQDQAATDQDKINAWQSGDVSDQEMIAYLQGRIGDASNDQQTNTQLKETLRQVQDSITSRQISDSAQSIMDGIDNGTRTWNDLKNYYLAQRKKYRPSDPFYKQLTDQINSVTGRIRDNEISGGIERAQYLFQSKQITGKQAAAQIRSLAARYKNEDPAKYYQLLQSASQLDQYGGFYKASGGGSGGGSGSGAASINDVIDRYQAMRNALRSLGDQFDAGQTVGVASDGSRYVLKNQDGTPTDQMRAIDKQTLDTYDLLAEAHRSKGDFSAAEADAADKMQYITGKIQPRNTIGPEQQRTALLDTLNRQMEIGQQGNDPQNSMSMLQKSLNTYRQWLEGVNTTRNVSPINKVEGADTIGSPVRRDAKALSDQTTTDFVQESVDIYNALVTAVQTGDASQVQLPEGLKTALGPMVENAAKNTAVLVGLQNGTKAWFSDPVKGLVVVDTHVTTDASGQQVVVPEDANGNILKDGQFARTYVPIGGAPVLSFAPTQDIQKWVGADVHDVNGNVLIAQGQTVTQGMLDNLAFQQRMGQIPKGELPTDASGKAFLRAGIVNVTQALVTGEDGTTTTWFGLKDAKGEVKGWSAGSIRPDHLVPAPIAESNPVSQQVIANKLNIDPTGQSYISGRGDSARAGAAALMKQAGLSGSLAGSSGPAPAQPRGGFFAGEPVGATPPPRFPQQPTQNPNTPFAGMFTGPTATQFSGGLTQKLQQTAQGFGISLRLPTVNQPSRVKRGGFFENADLTTNVRPPQIQGFSLNIPKVNLPSLLPFATSTRQEQRNASQHLAGSAGGGLIR